MKSVRLAIAHCIMKRSEKINSIWKNKHAQTQICDHPNCQEEGLYKAPRSRVQLNQYYWFCLKHVQEYNKAWNYYQGLTMEEIENLNRDDVTWNRPTWSFHDRVDEKIRERIFGAFNEATFEDKLKDKAEKAQRGWSTRQRSVTGEEKQAMEILDLDYPVDFPKIKTKYRQLAKKYHPDHNQGDKDLENHFKEINQAYKVLEGIYGK